MLFCRSSVDNFLFFLLDDDARRHHQHDAFRFTTHTAVLEETANVRDLVENRNTGHVTAFTQTLDTAQQNGAAIRNADDCAD